VLGHASTGAGERRAARLSGARSSFFDKRAQLRWRYPLRHNRGRFVGATDNDPRRLGSPPMLESKAFIQRVFHDSPKMNARQWRWHWLTARYSRCLRLSALRDTAAAKRPFRMALSDPSHPQPHVIKVTPTSLHSNILFIDTPGFVGRLEMTAQQLFQFRTVLLKPTPDLGVIRLQTALGQQLLDIAQRERVPQISTHGTKNQLRRRLPPLEDCQSGGALHDLFKLLAKPANVTTLAQSAPR
jgi:hypothetical protein